jgi:hypothetical protein
VSYSFVDYSDTPTPEAKNVFRCFVNGSEVDVSNRCYTEFENAGFKLSSINDQVAGESFNVELQAFKKGENGECVSISSGNQKIKLTYNPIMPTTASSMPKAFTINGTAIDSDSDTEIEVNFGSDSNGDGKAKLKTNYFDAGKISFTVSADLPLSDSTANDLSPVNDDIDFRQRRTISLDTQQQITAKSNPFVVRPDSFDIEVTDILVGNQLLVYKIVERATEWWPYKGGFKVEKAGTIVVDDSNGEDDDELNDGTGGAYQDVKIR